MIFGDRNRFAIEMTFDEFYDNDFIASGSFRIHVNNFAYGYNDSYSTTFYMIAIGLKKLVEENKLMPNIFKSYSDYEIARTYQTITFEGVDSSPEEKFLGLSKEDCCKSFFDFRWYTENAFDDCSFMLMFKENDAVKIIGFQMPVETQSIENVRSIEIPKYEFDDIVKKSYQELIKYRKSENKKK